jgi:lysozyme family protein
MVVNHGEKEATLMLQRSLWAIHSAYALAMISDGILGNQSINAVNSLILGNSLSNFLCSLRATRAQFIRGIVERHPEEALFLGGWLNRCYR